MLKILDIAVTQRVLNRASQIAGLVESIRNSENIERILLQRCYDRIQVWDGHHRLAAYFLSGWRTLTRDQYEIVDVLQSQRHQFGNIEKLLDSLDFRLE